MNKSTILIIKGLFLLIVIGSSSALAVDVIIKGPSTGDIGNNCTLDALNVSAESVTVTLSDPDCINTLPPDTTPPTLVTLSPIDNGSTTNLGTNLIATFSENIVPGTGNVVLYQSGGPEVESFNIATGAGSAGGSVTVSTNTLVIDPGLDLLDLSSYYVQIAATAIDDESGNSYGGISNSTAWNFTVSTSGNVVVLTPEEYIPMPPTLMVTPLDGILPGTVYAMEFANVTFDHDISLNFQSTSKAGYTDANVDIFLSYTPGKEGEVGSGDGCQYSNIAVKTVFVYSDWGVADCNLDPAKGTYYVNVKLSDDPINDLCGVTEKCIKTAFPSGNW